MFRAELDGKALDFNSSSSGFSGLRGMNFVMRDRDTGSLWQQATGEAFEGPLKGRRLTVVPFELTTWREWRTRHPATQVLLPEPRYEDQYRLMAERVAGLRVSTGPREATLRDDARLPPMTQVLGIENGGGRKAYPLSALEKRAVVNDHVGSTPVLLVHAAESETTTAFSRVVRGRTLTFRALSAGVSQLVDRETGSFSWAQFFPDTEVYQP